MKNQMIIYCSDCELAVTRQDGKSLTHEDIWNQFDIYGFDMDKDEMTFKQDDNWVEVYINDQLAAAMTMDVFELL